MRAQSGVYKRFECIINHIAFEEPIRLNSIAASKICIYGTVTELLWYCVCSRSYALDSFCFRIYLSVKWTDTENSHEIHLNGQWHT